MKRIVPGQKVKVYIDALKHADYGEVLGVGLENKIIVARRSDFKSLGASSFDHFRDLRDVVFLNGQQLPIIQWQPNSPSI